MKSGVMPGVVGGSQLSSKRSLWLASALISTQLGQAEEVPLQPFLEPQRRSAGRLVHLRESPASPPRPQAKSVEQLNGSKRPWPVHGGAGEQPGRGRAALLCLAGGRETSTRFPVATAGLRGAGRRAEVAAQGHRRLWKADPGGVGGSG